MKYNFKRPLIGGALRSSKLGSLLLALAFSVLGPGCSHLRTTAIPIRTASWPWRRDFRAETLVVLLPGRGDRWGDFERHGFISTMRDAGIRADIISVDAHLGYYYNKTVIDRLQEDVLGPARHRGYRRIILVGISLGGLGALLAARDQPASVDGLVLLSPYLGDNATLFKQIHAAGGPAAWAEHSPTQGKVDQEIWTFLGQHGKDLPPTWLLFGADDRLQTGQRLLASLLPASRVTIALGAHDWPTWVKLWSEVCHGSEVFALEKLP